MTVNSEVATAIFGSNPNASTNVGTRTVPPPIPIHAPSHPAPQPVTNSAASVASDRWTTGGLTLLATLRLDPLSKPCVGGEMSYRDDHDALAARHDALDVEVAEKTRERDKVAGLLADAKERARLPVLPNIRVATPCRADWNEMTGDERVRHCAHCDKDVFNLSSMTRDEAEALVLAKAGNLCARYYQRQDGTILL